MNCSRKDSSSERGFEWKGSSIYNDRTGLPFLDPPLSRDLFHGMAHERSEWRYTAQHWMMSQTHAGSSESTHVVGVSTSPGRLEAVMKGQPLDQLPNRSSYHRIRCLPNLISSDGDIILRIHWLSGEDCERPKIDPLYTEQSRASRLSPLRFDYDIN